MKLASIEKSEGKVALLLGRERLSLDRLPPEKIEWLARLSTPLLIEVSVEGSQVVSFGHVRPHPRVAALRAAADGRFGSVLESLQDLGDAVDDDAELLVARMRARLGLGRIAEGEADFVAFCHHVGATPALLLEAFRALPGASLAPCASAFAARVESMSIPQLRPFLQAVEPAAWSTEMLLRGADAFLSEPSADEYEVSEAEKLLGVARARSADPARVAAIVTRIASARKKLSDRARRQATQLLAARPDFDEVERLFAVALPHPLRAAWERHYEGETVGFGFIEAQAGKLDKLTKLSAKLLKDLEKAEQLDGKAAGVMLEELPFRLLPFGTGEHGDEYFALDLARPTGDGDFAVVVVFERRGEAWQTYPTSAAWLAADGVTSD